jgi:3D-(3,5/4)-trihydroxycyclohexane-1,2-dione acylhydrolase (decyclizing)
MAVTTSIGPGATNLVTAAATAHVNRLPLLLLPGDVFAGRAPDPVLQQLQSPANGIASVNDCLRPVSRYWDRITRPEQLLVALPEAMRVLTDPVECGPVTLSLPQDVQAEAYDFPEHFFATQAHRVRRVPAEREAVEAAARALRGAERPLIIAGGGVHYAAAWGELDAFTTAHGIPVAETQAGKGSLPWDHAQQVGSIGVTGSTAANVLAGEADLVLAIGTRLTDFTTASRTLFERSGATLIGLNVAPSDAHRHAALPLVADAAEGLTALSRELGAWRAPAAWTAKASDLASRWNDTVDDATAASESRPPTDAEVIGAVQRSSAPEDIVVCAAGGMPGELHKLWRTARPGGYHVEYGYSCMGYEIPGGLGAKMARPDCEVYVLVGDGSYLLMNSEIATSVAEGHRLIVVLVDNHGFGSISRLQQSTGAVAFNNLLADVYGTPPAFDFAAHARALGARGERVGGIAELEDALERARTADTTSVIVIEGDPASSTEAGGAWWDVPVAEHSTLQSVREARVAYELAKREQHAG